jgi:putative peptidoglycan lipid II flippase
MAFSVNPPTDRDQAAQAPKDGAITAADMKGLVGDSRAVAYGILASRITGFGRIAAAAAVLGPTFFGNLFQTAAVLPSTLYGLLMGTLISAVLVPPLVRRINGEDHERARRFACAALGVMMLVLLSVAVLALLLSPLLLRIITASVADPEIRREQVHLGIPLLIMVMPQIVLYGIAGAGMAVQQAYGRFALAAAAPTVENLINIAVLVTSAVLFGIGGDVSQISLAQLLLLGLGTTVAVAIHAGVQWFGAYRVGVALLPRLDWSDPEIPYLLRRGGATIGYTGLYWSAYLIILVIAGTVPGGVAAFQIANSFCSFPVALIAVPLALAQIPRLSDSDQRNDIGEFRAIYQSGLRLMMFAVVPAGLLLAGISGTLAGAAAFGAMSTTAGTALIAACVGSLGIGVLGEAAFTLTTPLCYTRQDTASPLRAMGLRLAIVAIGTIIVRLVFTPGIGLLWGLGASLAAANLVAGVYLCRSMLRALQSRITLGSSGFGSAFIVAVVSLVPARLLADWLGGEATASYGRVAQAIGVLGTAMALYLAIQFLRGSREMRLLLPAGAGRWTGRPRPADG